MVINRWNKELFSVIFLLISLLLMWSCEKNDTIGFVTPRIKKIELIYQVDSVTNTSVIASFQYDKSGKPEKIICYEGSSSTEYEIIYNNLAHPDSLVILYNDYIVGNYTRRFCLRYTDLVTLSGIDEITYGKNGEPESFSFFYDEQERIIKSCCNVTGSYEVYTYNDDNNIKELVFYDNDQPDPYRSAIYSFDSNPNPFNNNCPFLNHFVSLGILNGVSYQTTYFINKNNINALANTSGDFDTFYQFDYVYRDDGYPAEVEVSVSERHVYTYLYKYYPQ